MAEVQKHGLSLELALRESARFFGADQFVQSLQAEHDIPAQFDAEHGRPTWVKAVLCEPAKPGNKAGGSKKQASNAFIAADGRKMKANELCMADALRFWQTSGSVRLLVGFYEQKGGDKEFFDLREFNLTDASFAALRGGVPAGDISDLRDSLRAFGPGQAEAQKARRCAREDVARIVADHPGAKIQLRPKIDSKKQRRLQCAVSLAAMEQASDSARSVPLSEMAHYGFAQWPWAVASAPRVFKSHKQKEREAAQRALDALEGASSQAPEEQDARMAANDAADGAFGDCGGESTQEANSFAQGRPVAADSLSSLGEASGRFFASPWASESHAVIWH